MSTARRDPEVVLVTGGIRGLGLASARRLQAAGARVHLVWRSSHDDARRLEPEFPGRIHRADLARPEDARALLERVLAQDKGLDRLVHAVGEYVSGDLEHAGVEAARAMWRSNVETSIAVFDAARPALRAARGAAVFFGCAGLEGLRARRETAVYAAAKSALVVLARSWALEEARHQVRVNVVSPGLVPHADAAGDTLDPGRQARIPFGRAGSPAEIAEAVAFLCSDAARYTTGADLPVAGGWML